MRSNRRRSLVCVVAAMALLAAGCDSGGDDGASSSTSSSTTSTSTSSSAPAGNPQETANTITMTNFAFDPKALAVAKGALSFKLVNTGSAPHTFTIDDPKIDTSVPAGGEAQVLVATGDKTELVFYCRFHRAQGMEGKITVSG